MESIRQRQVAKLIQIALSEVFMQEAKEILNGAMVSVTSVRMAPDLLQGRVYLSIYNTSKPDEILSYIRYNEKELRRLLGQKIRNKVRRIPELAYFRDDSMDEVIKLESIFEEIKQKDQEIEAMRKSSDFHEVNPYKDESLNKES